MCPNSTFSPICALCESVNPFPTLSESIGVSPACLKLETLVVDSNPVS